MNSRLCFGTANSYSGFFSTSIYYHRCCAVFYHCPLGT